MKKLNFLLFFLGLFSFQSAAQHRYLTEEFDSADVTLNIVYGHNVSVLNPTVSAPLYLDLYEPAGDSETKRPLVLMLHSGTFLPAVTNLPAVSKGDSSIVYMATKLAKMGYVVASCDYRLGWNPLSPSQDVLLFGIMNAAYRGIQDTRNAIRFFKHDAANDDLYKIDPEKIVVWGNGTGGFLSLGAATLKDYTTHIAACCPDTPAKFWVTLGADIPAVNPAVNGDIYGTSLGYAPPGYPPFPEGALVNDINYVAYNSDFQMAVNLSGAIPDSSWIDENTVPMISFCVEDDQLTPCETGTVYTNTDPPIPIIEVSGSSDIQAIQNGFGNNDDWEGLGEYVSYMGEVDDVWVGPWSTIANERNDGLEGFFPLETPPAEPNQLKNNAPWEWWAEGATLPAGWWSLDADRARATCDTIIGYFAPRACITLDLGCNLIVDIDEVQAQKIDLQVSPNPASESVYFTTKEFPMLSIKIFDLTGRLVKEISRIDSFEYDMQRDNLSNGIYFAQVWFEDGFLSKQIIFQE